MAMEIQPDDFDLFAADMLEDEPVGKFQPLTLNEVRSAVSREILDCHGVLSSGSQIAEERRMALKFFFGEPLGNEVAGRSQVVMTEVADTVHWMLPSLIRMFASGEDIFEFVPSKESEAEAAKQATEFINQIFWEEMDGFQILYDWFFTTLLEKNGFVIVEWEERMEPKRERYSGLTEAQLGALMSDGRDLQVVEFQERQAILQGQEIALYDVTVQQTSVLGKINCRAIPPEEFLIARRAIKLDDDIPFVGERRKMTASDLIAMGYDPDEVASWPTDEQPEFEQSRQIRLKSEEKFPLRLSDRPDPASRELWVNNVYMRIDEDGDGYAELRHLMTIGDTSNVLIHDEYANHPPFATLTASPVAHKFFGQSIYDLVGDLQVIRTTLMRQLLDNLYLQNNGRMGVVRDEVEINDLLTSRPGGIVRMDSPESLVPIITPQLSPMALEMMSYLDSIRETRIGVSKWMQGLDGSSLNGTATGVNAMMGASQQRIELIGRIFAKTGLPRLGKLLLRAFVQNDNKKRVVRLRDQWVEVDPSSWNESMMCRVKTGLGIGSAQEMIGYLMAVLQLQKEAVMSGATQLVTPSDIYRASTELTKAMGFSRTDTFFTDPGDQGWPEPEPDTKLLENQRRTVDDQAKNEISLLEAETIAREKQALEDFRRMELEQKRELELKRFDTMLEVARIQASAADQEDTDGGPDTD